MSEELLHEEMADFGALANDVRAAAARGVEAGVFDPSFLDGDAFEGQEALALRRTTPDGAEAVVAVLTFVVTEYDELIISMLWVAPDARRRGCARRLIAEAAKRGEAAGARRAVWMTLEGNNPMQRLSRGFAEVEVWSYLRCPIKALYEPAAPSGDGEGEE